MSKLSRFIILFSLATCFNFTKGQYYELLGLKPTSTSQEIEKKCRQLKAQYHPDRPQANPRVAQKKLLEISNACDILIGKNKVKLESRPPKQQEKDEAEAILYEQFKKGIFSGDLNLIEDAIEQEKELRPNRNPYYITLVNRFYDKDEEGKGVYVYYSPLYVAVELERPDIVDVLIKAGADVNEKSNGGSPHFYKTPIYAAKSAEMVERLIAAHAGVYTPSSTSPIAEMPILYWAAFKGYPAEVFKALIKHGAHVDEEYSEDGTIALYEAVRGLKVTPEVIDLLIKAGSDVNHKDKQGNTILDTALELQAKAQKNDDIPAQIKLLHYISSLKKAGARESSWYSRWIRRK